ncbi:esterase/lipase family protein [Bacillus sp. USDA818B3_A]|uniref:esterase/lipase family protein n=1 Tax=Bacillus sp. USDA818B3_A TaxID=2698834 RepID=UPI0013707675|nr:alpha/beta hydrolase [Bacillus sp. USDA818B3_A]
MSLKMDIKKRENEQDNKVLVVLIHGLGAPETWSNEDNGNWQKLILNDPELENIDLGIVTYDTALVISGILRISGTLKLGKREISISKDKVTGIGVLARELKRELDRRSVKKYEKIILVGHSMGGLIGIHYLLQEIENGNQTKVFGYLSMATPFNGSALAEFHKLFKGIQSHEQIQQLSPNNDFLDETIRLWQSNLDSDKLKNVDFKFCYGIKDEVVTQNSAIPFVSGKKWTQGVPLPGTHGGILNINEQYESAAYIEFRDHVLNVCENEVSSLAEVKNESTLDVSITNYKQSFELTTMRTLLSDHLDLELVLHNSADRTVTVWEIVLKRGNDSKVLEFGEDLIVLGPGVSKKRKFSIRQSKDVYTEYDVLETVIGYAKSQMLIIKDNNKNEVSMIILDGENQAFKQIDIDKDIEEILIRFGERNKEKFSGLQ